jgi:hypothetical protein
MKLKVNLDKKAIRDFLLQNVEKIALGAVAVVFLLMLYSALATAGRFDRTPEQLQTQAANGRRELDSTPPESSLIVSNYISQAKRSRVHIQETPYRNLALWDKPVFERRPLRDAPPLFAVQQLRGMAGVGAFRKAVAVAAEAQPEQPEVRRSPRADAAAAGPPFLRGRAPGLPILRGGDDSSRGGGGEEVRGQRWIVVTGLVPVEKQETAYAEAFKPTGTYDSQDSPVYNDCLVQRVEVGSPGEAADPDWKKATSVPLTRAVETAQVEWSASAGVEVVAPAYTDSRLTFPLPPLVNRGWDPSVAHEPEIPAQRSTERAMGEPGNPMGLPRGGPVGNIRRPMLPILDGRDREPTAEGSAFDPEAAKPTEPRPNLTVETNDPREQKKPPYKLFRFFDFSVEPGKQYVYRVCLALENPNWKRKPALLVKPELANDQFLKTKWSEPSSVISVPRDTSILLVSVKSAVRANSEPSGQILVTKWLQRKGAEVFKEFTVTRGQVANFPDIEVRVGGGRRTTGNVGGVPTFSVSGGRVKVNFFSGATAVDFRGGERLPGRRGSTLNAAGEILLLDSDGTLMVRNELDDTPAYEQLTSSETEQATEEAGSPRTNPGMAFPPAIGHGRPGLEAIEEHTPAKGRPAAKPK